MYKVYYTRLHKTDEKVDWRNPDSPYYWNVELVFVGKANSMVEAKRLTAVPILERLE